jgi:hypothetical protein
MEKFENIDRKRYYGLRIGDLVSPKGVDGKEWHKGVAEVVNYGSDNNRVEIKSKDGTITDWVAEWCEIMTRVEDKTKKCDSCGQSFTGDHYPMVDENYKLQKGLMQCRECFEIGLA